MGWTHLGDAKPKARKRHYCFLCQEAIEPGEAYVRRSGINDDGPESFAMHPECEVETRSWDIDEWESFCPGDGFDRPREGVAGGRTE